MCAGVRTSAPVLAICLRTSLELFPANRADPLYGGEEFKPFGIRFLLADATYGSTLTLFSQAELRDGPGQGAFIACFAGHAHDSAFAIAVPILQSE